MAHGRGQRTRLGASLAAVALFFSSFIGAEEPRSSTARFRYLLLPGGKPVDDHQQLPLILRSELDDAARAPEQGAVRWRSVVGQPLAPGSRPPAGGVRLRPLRPGSYELPLKGGGQRISVVATWAMDTERRIAQRAAISRSLPVELRLNSQAGAPEDKRRFVFMGTAEGLPTTVELISESSTGRFTDSLSDVPLFSFPCEALGKSRPRGAGLVCAATPLIRIAGDLVDRNHPVTLKRSILGEVGGRISVHVDTHTRFSLLVGAPEELEPGGPGRYGVRLHARVLRTYAGGPPAVGVDDREAAKIVREEVASASRMWGQCGVHLGDPAELDVEVVDPPRLSMVTIGCGRSLPASGGQVRFKAGGRSIFVRTRAGETPQSVAARVAESARSVGLVADVYRNSRSGRSPHSSFDLVLTDRRGQPVSLEMPPLGFNGDPTLSVCPAQLELADGLKHFTDENAGTGTVEERYLLRALSDDDPSTIELIVVPVFGGLGRIGESFIYTPGGSVDSALILDRTGIRAGSRSFTLAHELGHILLDLPGHPDDFGVDTPSSLMDADAADSTIFGPRRLTLEDCKRALRQSGRDTAVPLLYDWPLQ